MIADRWEVSIVRADGSVLVPRLVSGSLDWDITRKTIYGGRLTTPTVLGDLVGALLQVWLYERGRGPAKSRGAFIVTACDPSWGDTLNIWTVEFMDPTVLLDRERLVAPVSYPAITPAVKKVREIASRVGVKVGVDDSDQTLRTAVAFNANTTQLDVVNKLLEAVGYHPLRAFTASPYSAPLVDAATLYPVHVFREGEESLHVPSYPQKQSYLDVPNRLVATSRGDNNNPPLVSIARDQRASRWSYETRGHWFDADPITVECVKQTDLEAEAKRRLRELQMNAVTMTIQHLFVPAMYPGCVVELVTQNPEVSGLWQATASTVDMVDISTLAQTSLRRVNP